MATQWWIGLISSFLASGVEVVEAVTIVLAVGVTRGWRSAWIGIATAALVLAALVAILGSTLQYLPIGVLRIVIGTLLLIFGLQWLRKAIMRYTGLKGLHDETAIYQREVAELSASDRPSAAGRGMDWTAFTVAFKGVLLEGLEVVFIVITFGLTAGDVTPALLGSVLAAVLVTGIAVAVHKPLSQVPENSLKFVVGIMLTAFGTFWAGEGVGLTWPGEDLAILVLIAFYAISGGLLIALVRQRLASGTGSGKVVSGA